MKWYWTLYRRDTSISELVKKGVRRADSKVMQAEINWNTPQRGNAIKTIAYRMLFALCSLNESMNTVRGLQFFSRKIWLFFFFDDSSFCSSGQLQDLKIMSPKNRFFQKTKFYAQCIFLLWPDLHREKVLQHIYALVPLTLVKYILFLV